MQRYLIAFLVLAAGVASPASNQLTVFDEIQDTQERQAVREVWNASDPRKQLDLTMGFVAQYPRSILLREVYELAARASVALGDHVAGLDWAKQSLRLMPENPFLLVMVADIAAKQSQLEFAETSARDALRYLATAHMPAPMAPERWPSVRNELEATAHFVLGRVAATQGRYKDAEQSLVSCLRLNPNDIEAAYVLAVVWMAVEDNDNAAMAFARVITTNGPLAGPARNSLRALYERKRPGAGISFDAWARSLKWNPPAPRPAEPSQPQPMDRYAGSAACRDCHSRIYESWKSTGMSKMLRPYDAADIIGDFSGQHMVSGSARAISDSGRHFIEIREGESNRWNRYPVDYVIGSKWQQAYATRLPDSRFLVFPIQYSRLQSSWINYWRAVDSPGTPRTDISRFHLIPEDAIYQNACAPCHTSQLKFERPIQKDGPYVGRAGPFGPADAVFREPGVNCEMCHGPSLNHVESMKGLRISASITRPGRSGIDPPVSFKRLSSSQYVAVCAQCHAQSAVHDAEATGAVNYSEQGPPFYRAYSQHLPSDFSRTAFYRDGRYRATTFISEAFARSECYRRGGATCGSCHDPHPANVRTNPNSLKFGEDNDEMCVQCHTSLRREPERHTRHAAGTEASRCVSCHMPRIMEALLFPARSHEIDDVPDASMTERFGNDTSPNACLTCHRDRNAAWLREKMEMLFNGPSAGAAR
jgi:predicted CXXCH cytochrome family protein